MNTTIRYGLSFIVINDGGITLSKIYSSTEAAAEIGTTPRLLRRFLRSNDSWKNATQAGRYSFDESELASLTKQFNKWHGGRSIRRVNHAMESTELEYLDQDKGISVDEMHKLKDDIALRKEVMNRRIQRQRRLDERLAELRMSEREEVNG